MTFRNVSWSITKDKIPSDSHEPKGMEIYILMDKKSQTQSLNMEVDFFEPVLYVEAWTFLADVREVTMT